MFMGWWVVILPLVAAAVEAHDVDVLVVLFDHRVGAFRVLRRAATTYTWLAI